MEIFLLRHAEAIGTAPSGLDSDRFLSEEGKKTAQQCAKGLKSLSFSFDCIYTSPYIRAKETAEIFAEVLDYSRPIVECEYLAPGGDFNTLFRFLQKSDQDTKILLVGHEPSMGNLASVLISGKPNSNIRFPKCGLCYISIYNLPPLEVGELKWMLSPKILKKLRPKKSDTPPEKTES